MASQVWRLESIGVDLCIFLVDTLSEMSPMIPRVVMMFSLSPTTIALPQHLYKRVIERFFYCFVLFDYYLVSYIFKG